jgi:hypothetical protein
MRWFRLSGVLLLFALGLVVAEKVRAGEAFDLFWFCYPAAALLCLGLLVEQPLWASSGALFHLAAGLPCWLISVYTTRTTTAASVVLHLAAPGIGLAYLRRAGLHPRAKWFVVVFYLALIFAGRWLTPPALNVNMAFGPYESLPLPLPRWASAPFNFLGGLALLTVVERLLLRLNRSSGTAIAPARR